jgi:integrase
LPAVTLHQLRHYLATQAISAGHDPVTVAEVLGHSRPSMTLDVYSSFVPAKGRAIADHMAGLVPELPPTKERK